MMKKINFFGCENGAVKPVSKRIGLMFAPGIRRFSVAALCVLLCASAVTGAGAASLGAGAGGQPYTAVEVGVEETPEITLHDMPESAYFDLPSPSIFSDHTEGERGITEGDIYVSPNGSDDGDGSKEHPFATLTRARDEVRKIKKSGLPEGGITVSVMGGRYQSPSLLTLSSEDSGKAGAPIRYVAYGDSEPIFSGSVPLDPGDFKPVSSSVRNVLRGDAKDNVLMIDLTKYGVTSNTLRYLPIGVTNKGPANVEFYADRENYALARYPNGEEILLPTGFVGDRSRNITMKLSDEAAARVKGWSSTKDIYVLGIFTLEWEDTAAKATINASAGTVTLPGVNGQSVGSGDARFCFYNVLDELDEPGEWYLDRDKCILYVYPKEDFENSFPEIVTSYSSAFVRLNGCSYVEFEGLTFSCSKGNGIQASSASNCTVSDCTFYGFGNNAYTASSSNYNTVSGCDISYVGHSGIVIENGGDKGTLSGGHNVIDNNLVTHWGLNARVFTPAISASAQSTRISHNELCYSTSNAIISGSNNSVIEYNLVHDCTKMANDCGAFYNGSSWTAGGNIIRYNCFYNIGNDDVHPSVIYWDDGMAYQIAYGNLIVNVAGYAFSIGGGFGQTVLNNVVVNSAFKPVLYDSRPLNGYRSGDSFYQIGGFIWNLYKSTPVTSQVWREHFPLLSQVLQNEKDIKSPHFGFNSAFSLFSDNVFLNEGGAGKDQMNPGPIKYSTEIDNYIGKLDGLEDLFVDPAAGDYRVREDSPIRDVCTDFIDIHYERIGRY